MRVLVAKFESCGRRSSSGELGNLARFHTRSMGLELSQIWRQWTRLIVELLQNLQNKITKFC